MKEETNQLAKESNEGIRFLCLLFGIIGILLLIISVFTTPILIIISIILCILGIIFSAIYKSIAGLIVNIIGVALIPIGLIVGTFLLTSMYNNAYEGSKEIESMYNNINDSEKIEYEETKVIKDFNYYFNNKNEKIIYYASSQCGYCELETPIIEQIEKDYNIDYLYIDSTKLTSSERDIILEKLNIEHATPTTVIVKNGEVIDTQVGYIDGSGMIDFLKENKVLDAAAIYTPEQYLTFIDYEEYNNLLKEEGKQIITIGQTGCSHCIATKPVLNSIAKDYNITVNYLNITEMKQFERDNLTNSLSEIGYDEEEFVSTGSFGTPLTLIIENGKVISYVNGERPTSQFVRAFKNAGIISE